MPQDKLNIVFFVTSLNSGGIENYLLRFLTDKSDEFKKIYIYCKSGHAGQLEDKYLGINNVSIIKHQVDFIRPKALLRLYKFLSDSNIDVVCDFTGNFSGKILLLSYKAKIPKRIAFYRGSTNHFKKSLLKNIYNSAEKRLVEIYATDILSNSKASFNFFFKKKWKNDNRFEVIYNGVNAEVFLQTKHNLRALLGIPKGAFVVGHTGRFDSAKNHETIISVAERLVKKHEDIYFILCGNGVNKALAPILKAKNIDNKVFAFENRTDIPEFLNTMDCYFFPSRTEGQPNALIEALIMGLPFVASNIAPIKEIAPNSSNLYHPDDIDSFVSSLTAIYLKRPIRDSLQQQEFIAKFDHKKNFQKFLSRIYDF